MGTKSRFANRGRVGRNVCIVFTETLRAQLRLQIFPSPEVCGQRYCCGCLCRCYCRGAQTRAPLVVRDEGHLKREAPDYHLSRRRALGTMVTGERNWLTRRKWEKGRDAHPRGLPLCKGAHPRGHSTWFHGGLCRGGYVCMYVWSSHIAEYGSTG